MKDFLHKFRQYFVASPDYWKLTKPVQSNYAPVYPLSFSERLNTGHYVDFDELGIPLFPSKSGELVHFITGMCSYGFANWEMFLNTGKQSYVQEIVKVADYITNCVEMVDGIGMLYDYERDSRLSPGVPCAMNHGEAISVLVRVYSYTKNENYLKTAEALVAAFTQPFGPRGVTADIDGHTWYLEGGKKILNGHIYATLGLYDLSLISERKDVKVLFEQGLDTVAKLLPQFDAGFWSWYWLDKPRYMASAMYHNLHICQLRILANLSRTPIFKTYSDRFAGYAASSACRLRSGVQLFYGKIRKKLL